MKKIILIITLNILVLNMLKSQTTIYVSNLGPVYTLKGAYDLIASPGSITYNIIIKNDISIASRNSPGFVWTKTGTSQFPINIYSENCYSKITRTSESAIPMITLKNVNYINFFNIHFFKGVMGTFLFDNADNCKIDYCKFSGDGTAGSVSAGIIWIGENCQGNPSSYGNIISNNKFFNMQTTSQTNQHHAIYISNKAYNNSIFNNTIIAPPSYSIHGWHGDYNTNSVANNLCIQENNPLVPSSMVIGFNPDYDGCINGYYSPSGINNNFFYNNYVYDNQNTSCLTINNSISTYNNSGWGNVMYNNLYPNDPYWLGYSPSQISSKMVSGDFNGDGYKDDVAAFYDNGNGTTNIHVWKTDPISSKAFIYDNGSSGWWYGSSYTASQITGRVISGDFNGDGKTDLAAFYDYGNNNTQIHVWKSNGSSFDPPLTWWNVGGYNANKISGRVVCGDFNNDGLSDIAAFYDNGNGNTNLHVWTSTSNGFIYNNGAAGWWSVSNGGYNVNKITNRVVAGDFDGDTQLDDIAAFYDNGNGSTNLHVWLSTGKNPFTYQYGSGWWGVTSGYDVNKITGRVVAGNFNGDNKTDIAAFYDNGNGSTNLHVWLSTGANPFTYQYGSGWWGVTSGYDVNKITGRVVSGDFNRDHSCNNITGFYDYANACGALRSNVWQQSGSSFNYANSSLGYPWLTTFQFSNSKLSNDLIENIQEQEFAKTSLEFDIFPNPTNGQISIETNEINEETILFIYNIEGQMLYKQTIKENKSFIDISNLTKGIYFVKLFNDKTFKVRKIIKE